MTSFSKTAFFLGSGFSADAGLPTVSEISDSFLQAKGRILDETVEDAILDHLRIFWKDVFLYEGSQYPPNFEDHFTTIDLAANVGHGLGPVYTPSKLRAIRRLSLHRIFSLLRIETIPDWMSVWLKAVTDDDTNGIISTNWDMVVEAALAEHRMNVTS